MNVILLAAISADGKIAQKEGQTSLDWTSKEDTRFFIEKTKEIGVVIMGRKTFETIGKPLKGRRLIVMTSKSAGRLDVGGNSGEKSAGPETSKRAADFGQEGKIPSEGTVEFTNLSPRQLLQELKNQGHDAVVVAGGSSVYSQFLKERLVTDLYLTIEPILFGNGIPLAVGFDRMNLEFVEMRPLGSQSIVLHYRSTDPAIVVRPPAG